MVLPFQTQEVARTDVQEAKLPTVLIDVEVRHCPTTVPPESRTLFWRISCWGEAGCSCSSSLIRAMGPPFLLEPTDPSPSIITSSGLNGSGRTRLTRVRGREILRSWTSGLRSSRKFGVGKKDLDTLVTVAYYAHSGKGQPRRVEALKPAPTMGA